jgi:probable HAF family extracellular repeat protein
MRRLSIRLCGLLPALSLALFAWLHQAVPSYDLIESSEGDLYPAANRATLAKNTSSRTSTSVPAVRPSDSSPHYARYISANGLATWSEYRGSGAKGCIRGFLSRQGHTIDLGTLGGRSCVVNGLNAAGHVIGWSHTQAGEQHAFLWRDGQMLDLGTLPGGRVSYAYALNDRDEVVGQADTETEEVHAFVWRDRQMRDLGLLPRGRESSACALNNRGQVVGRAITESGAYHAVVWKEDKIADLNYLVPFQKGLTLEQALSIDEQGRIQTKATRQRQERMILLVPRQG